MNISESLMRFYKLSAMIKNQFAFDFAKTITQNMDKCYRVFSIIDKSLLDVDNIKEVWNNKLTVEFKNETIKLCNIEEDWIDDLFEIIKIAFKIDYDPDEMINYHRKYII